MVLIVSAYDIVIKSIGYFRMIDLGWYKSIKVIPIMPIDIFYTKWKQTTSGFFKNDQSIVKEPWTDFLLPIERRSQPI